MHKNEYYKEIYEKIFIVYTGVKNSMIDISGKGGILSIVDQALSSAPGALPE